MNLLVVTQYFHPENFRINDLVEGMVARGQGALAAGLLQHLPVLLAGGLLDLLGRHELRGA